MKEVTIQQVEEIVAVLTADEKQLLKKTLSTKVVGEMPKQHFG